MATFLSINTVLNVASMGHFGVQGANRGSALILFIFPWFCTVLGKLRNMETLNAREAF
jgi:hypothetical protein